MIHRLLYLLLGHGQSLEGLLKAESNEAYSVRSVLLELCPLL
jgi:hypothetical protein